MKKECKKFSLHLVQAHERNILRALQWLSGFGSVSWFTRTSYFFGRTYLGHPMLQWASLALIPRPCYLRDTFEICIGSHSALKRAHFSKIDNTCCDILRKRPRRRQKKRGQNIFYFWRILRIGGLTLNEFY